MKRATAFVWLAALMYCATAGAASYESVKTDSGALQGVVAGDVVSFKGIPYAAPPVGPLRWRAPQTAAPWNGVRKADQFGNVCVSSDATRDSFAGKPPESEDCLTVNVWRPNDANGKLPVLVWIHGGAMLFGSSAVPTYDGAAFAKHGIVLVSFNYRLGNLGFFAHPALSKENADGGRIANYAFMDQIAALQWVQKNIAAFGGDPARVTIFGESAGGLSIYTLMTMPSSRGLFQGAIAESGYGREPFARLARIPHGTDPTAESSGVNVMQRAGVTTDDPAVLRAVPVDAFKKEVDQYRGALPIVDGKVVTEDLWNIFRKGREMPVPFIAGSNSLESPPSPASAPYAKTQERYLKSDERGALTAAYGGAESLSDNLPSDITFVEQARAFTMLHETHGHPAYRYRFSVVPDSLKDKFKGAAHAAELPYVFNTLSTARAPTGSRDQAVADVMQSYWVAFVKTGTPNAPGLRPWEPVKGDKIIDFTNVGPKPEVDPRAGALEALSKVIDDRS